MQSLNFSELKNYGQWIKDELLEAQLQEVWTNGEILVFEFYRNRELYLCVDTRMQAPALVLLGHRPSIEKVKKPVSLFLNSHAKNLRFKELEVLDNKGRVVSVLLASAKKDCELEIQLIPKNFNLRVLAGDKKISWNQVRELPPAMDIPVKIEARDWSKYGNEWYAAFSGPGTAPRGPKNQAPPKDPRLKDIEKKQKALVSIRETLNSSEALLWRELGESLKTSAEVPPHLKKHHDPKKSKSWNMEHAFAKMKSLEKKRKGTEERAVLVEKEIAKLEKSLKDNPEWGGTPEKPKRPSSGNKLLNKADSKGRKKQFADGIEAVIGKSATENLAILRAAQAWDLWLHLKDFPGAHAIITRPRNKIVPQEIIREVSEWLFAQTFSGKRIDLGAKYDVVVAECRYVRPIKGDRLGRVNYQNPQVFSFASKSES